jgi:hypothetical protein
MCTPRVYSNELSELKHMLVPSLKSLTTTLTFPAHMFMTESIAKIIIGIRSLPPNER